MSNLLILSAAYVEPELEAEFGRIPPAFLPLGNRRLFVHQISAMRARAGRVYLSIPEDFELHSADLHKLDDEDIRLVRVPQGLTLGQSLIYTINVTATAGQRLSLLFGDTLIRGVEADVGDLATIVHDLPDLYRWGEVADHGGRLIPLPAKPPPIQGSPLPRSAFLTGFFEVIDTAGLVQSITRCNGDFLAGLGDYASVRTMRLVEADCWYDFGHAATYHRSRRHVSTARHFNRVVANRRAVWKSSSNTKKIEAEANWFEALPAPMRIHTPAYLGRAGGDRAQYGLEYLNLPTLADLYVFGRLPRRTWDSIFVACDEFLSSCASHPAPADVIARYAEDRSLFHNKTLDRLEEHARTAGIPLDKPCRYGGRPLPSLERIVHISAAGIPTASPFGATLVHGDFCFSNAFYDMRSGILRVIDPRGMDATGNPSVYGDLRYDFGKLHHSAVGQYDHIIAGHYQLRQEAALDLTLELPDGETTSDVAAAYLGRSFAGVTPADAAAPAISVLLFLSMLPLHTEDPQRQAALLGNAMRLFLSFDR